jgi:hypothetical protein
MPFTFQEGDAVVVAEERFAPIYVSTWFGEATERVVMDYFAYHRRMMDEHIRARRPFAIITDATDAERPSPKVRSLIAEITDASADPGALMVGNYLVLSNALVRGAFTAMQWLSRKRWPTIVVATPAEAVSRALDELAKVGAPLPSITPAGYVRPSRPKRA